MGIRFETWPSTSIIVYIYCIWAGLGYNVLLLSGAIGRIPKELLNQLRWMVLEISNNFLKS